MEATQGQIGSGVRQSDKDSLVYDQDLSTRLAARADSNPSYWDFRHLGARSGSHGFFQYPAMMVPELQGALLEDVVAVDKGVTTVYDPFVGSGTVLVETVTRGFDFIGGDVNPMAVLLSSVKADPPPADEAIESLKSVLRGVRHGKPEEPRPFFGRDKWFRPEVIDDLQRLRSSILALPSLHARRFMWVCLAETIRLTSNSRISTFKLHLYPKDVLESRHPDTIATFEGVTERNLRGLADYWSQVVAADIELGKSCLLQGQAAQSWREGTSAPDVLMTSPPYGDNRTTVPYGQHSYLPLQWVDTNDIPGGVDSTLLSSTSAIDSASLGGSNVGVLQRRAELEDVSDSLGRFLREIEGQSDLLKKVLSFTGDYYNTLSVVSSRLRDDAYCFFTLGERRVGKRRFPLVSITDELLRSIGHTPVHKLNRNLPIGRKRMAVANSEGATMATETVLVTRRGGTS